MVGKESDGSGRSPFHDEHSQPASKRRGKRFAIREKDTFLFSRIQKGVGGGGPQGEGRQTQVHKLAPNVLGSIKKPCDPVNDKVQTFFNMHAST
jgi:hypothetical protein